MSCLFLVSVVLKQPIVFVDSKMVTSIESEATFLGPLDLHYFLAVLDLNIAKRISLYEEKNRGIGT